MECGIERLVLTHRALIYKWTRKVMSHDTKPQSVNSNSNGAVMQPALSGAVTHLN
jgi:hypothetical protein